VRLFGRIILNAFLTGCLHSRSNKGYFSRDVMSGLIPEQDDCEEALEYCRELVDVYEPPLGSGLVVGEDANVRLTLILMRMPEHCTTLHRIMP